ncbi:hypothetical protein GCM10009597_44350 [Peribacillus frigoritolerans]
MRNSKKTQGTLKAGKMEMVRWRKEFYKSRGYEKARKGVKKPIRFGRYE